MTDEFNSDGDPPVGEISIAEFAALQQQVKDHIKVCDRLKILNRWVFGLVILTIIELLFEIYRVSV